jgi:hypothetical protein
MVYMYHCLRAQAASFVRVRFVGATGRVVYVENRDSLSLRVFNTSYPRCRDAQNLIDVSAQTDFR